MKYIPYGFPKCCVSHWESQTSPRKKKKRELKNSQAIVGIMCLSMVIEEDTLAIYSPTIAIIDHSLVRLH